MYTLLTIYIYIFFLLRFCILHRWSYILAKSVETSLEMKLLTPSLSPQIMLSTRNFFRNVCCSCQNPSISALYRVVGGAWKWVYLEEYDIGIQSLSQVLLVKIVVSWKQSLVIYNTWFAWEILTFYLKFFLYKKLMDVNWFFKKQNILVYILQWWKFSFR